MIASAGERMEFRDPVRGAALVRALHRLADDLDRTICLMHVCGSHEQAIGRFGLRAGLPAGIEIVMGPGCPVCVTDGPEIDEAIAIARQDATVLTYGDMLKVPGTTLSLGDSRAEGAAVEVVYSIAQGIEIARARPGREVVFFASGFETTAVATAAAVLAGLPENFSILSAHKYIPPAMEVVACVPGTRVEGFLAAGHAATITGCAVFDPFVERHQLPVVVAGFEPLDILAALVKLSELVLAGTPRVVNMYPRCVSREGNQRALAQLWKVFCPADGRWRGIASVPGGNLQLRDEWAHVDARRRFDLGARVAADQERSSVARRCLCGRIMSGIATPADCALFGHECVPDHPVGACMVSSEGVCRIWSQYGAAR